MRVLVTETLFGDAEELAGQLRAAGCHVSRCHRRTGVCQAVAPGGRCPLDEMAPIDLLVDVRSPDAGLTAREYGVICALRARVPVAIVPVGDTEPVVPAGLARRVTALTRRKLLDVCRETAHRQPAGATTPMDVCR